MNKERYINKLNKIKESGNYRMLRDVQHNGFLIHYNEREMLNLSSNDYLGLASNPVLYEDFRKETDVKLLSYSAVSSRLLSGNHEYYSLLENDLSDFIREGGRLGAEFRLSRKYRDIACASRETGLDRGG